MEVKIATKIRREKNENCVEFSFHSISGYWFYNTICKGIYTFCQNLHEYICFETYMNRFFGKRIIIFVTYCLNMPFFVNTFQLKDKKYMVDMYDV